MKLAQYYHYVLKQIQILKLVAMAASSSPDQCDIDLRLYSSSSDCLRGFYSQQMQQHSIIADGECHNSGTESLGYYIATCDGNTDRFQLVQSGCTDKYCTDCTKEVTTYSGEITAGGCMVDWTVSDLDQPGSLPFSPVADEECQYSGIPAIGYYSADCNEDGNWFEFSRSGCSNDSCTDCTKVSESQEVLSPFKRRAAVFTYLGKQKQQCHVVDAFYKEQVWSISGSCQRTDCSEFVVPKPPPKWWANKLDGGTIQCTYDNGYPEEYQKNSRLINEVLFDSREECCQAYARVGACQSAPSPTTTMPAAMENISHNNSATLLQHSSSLIALWIGILLILL